MGWWKWGKSAKETITAERLSEQLAEMYDPMRRIEMMNDNHLDARKLFLALAALRLAGFQLAITQESIQPKLTRAVMQKLHVALVGNMLHNYACSPNAVYNPDTVISELLDLAQRIVVEVHANAKSEPHPVWYAGKEICMYVNNEVGIPNPEEVMSYGQYLHETMVSTKSTFDKLLEAGVEIIE